MTNRDAARVQQMIRRYRYRTTALVGTWRASPELAIQDAINARLALREEGEPGGIRWIVPGNIEETEA
jgi:hypothetical protein